jgi:hypothetical protein
MNSNIYNILSQKVIILSCYDQHGIMLLYDNNVSLTQLTTIMNSSAEFITAHFNNNTQELLYKIANYKPPKMHTLYFCCILESIIHKMLSNCLTTIIEDFNIYHST